VEDCPIFIEGKTLPAKLVVFKMLGFDVILGMDSLSKHYASIDCQGKVVTFRPPRVMEFRFGGAQVRAALPLLLAVQAKKCIKDGGHAFLACVVWKLDEEMKLEDIKVVKDYPDVFSELLGLAPNREMGFVSSWFLRHTNTQGTLSNGPCKA
jgi:hypothetical protein